LTLHVRKQNRLQGYDYNTMGAYFITICVKERYEILSEILMNKNIVGDGSPVPHKGHPLLHNDIPDVSNDLICVYLSPVGKIVKKYIDGISAKYSDVHVNNYVIMPDHIHLLLILNTFRTEISNGMGNINGTGNPSPTTTVGKVVGWFKYQTTKEINRYWESLGQRLWQRSYYDHVIRNEKDYENVYRYIENNPARWLER